MSENQGQQNRCSRRASAIFLTPYLSLEKKWYVVALGFKSLDWPKIIHKPGRRARTESLTISVDNNNFNMYFEEAFNTVIEYLQNNDVSQKGARYGRG